MGRIRNPVPTAEDYCIICEQPYAHLHEIFYGRKNRQKSIKYGLQVRLCNYHHQHWEYSPHRDPAGEFNKGLQREAQRKFEREQTIRAAKLGITPREFFRLEFGKNYL